MKKKGFTLIELMVTITIMLIMTSVLLFNYGRFNESTLLNAFAYDMSLTIRQAQVYGTATRQGAGLQSDPITINNFGGSNSNFSSAYGVHFDIRTPNLFILFIDSDHDERYDNGEVPLQTYLFQRGIKIRDLCYTALEGKSHTCFNDSGKSVSTTLDITFKRPDPEAIILPDDPSQLVSDATIYLQSADDANAITRSVVVYSTGQISVQ